VFIIGVDPHKGSHTAAVLDRDEQFVGEIRVRADRDQRARLLCFASEFELRVWAFAGMGLHSHAASYALGSHLGGPEGDGMIADAHLWMQTQKIKDPQSITRMMIPCGVAPHA
jgi:hypothetical protein